MWGKMIVELRSLWVEAGYQSDLQQGSFNARNEIQQLAQVTFIISVQSLRYWRIAVSSPPRRILRR